METLGRAITPAANLALWQTAFRRAPFSLLLILSAALPLRAQTVFQTKDISPDGTNFTGSSSSSNPSSSNPAGRIKSLIIDPNNDKILYAAAEFSGVWKTTTGATWVSGPNGHDTSGDMNWVHASKGLRSGLTVNNTSLAIDNRNSKRLLYATGDDDGRPTQSLGGLWVSIDAAGTWTHQNPCPSLPTGVVSVAFTNGQPFVSANCGIVTTANRHLDGGWTVLPKGKISPPAGSLVVDGGFGTLFACSGTQVFRATDAGASGMWSVLNVGGPCFHLTAVPNGTSASTTAVVIWVQPNNQEVSVVNFGNSTSPVRNLKFPSRRFQPTPTTSFPGSGQSAVATAPITAAPGTSPGPGITYDLYAADSCAWYAFHPGASPPWTMLASTGGSECNSNTTRIHADTWAMAFPSWYDPANPAGSFCAAYAATDGGVFFAGGKLARPVVGGCTSNWGRVQNGLHALESNAIYAITVGSGHFPASSKEAIYLPTGDNDLFVKTIGSEEWQNLNSLGDAGTALVDPGFPNQVIVARNGLYIAVSNPPFVGGAFTPIVNQAANVPPLAPPQQFDVGIGGGGAADLTQVMTSVTEPPRTSGDYLAVLDQDPPHTAPASPVSCSASLFDLVERNQLNPPGPGGWKDVSPNDHFLACDIGKIQAAGGHADGSLNIYVLTGLNDSTSNPPVNYSTGRGPGQIYLGVVSNGQVRHGQISHWAAASGSPGKRLGLADNFFVNPYDPKELYAVSVASQAIKVSRDFGGKWTTDPTLTDIATNHGEYRIGCLGTRGDNTASSPFKACSLAGMAFDVYSPNIRVAAMLYGGIAFSRDSGNHWMALDLTDNNHLVSDNLTQMVVSCFFDGETLGAGYWLGAADGGVFTFGDAPFFNSIPGRNISLNAPVVGMARTPSGKGYWLVAGDGGVFTFGDAPFFGSIPGTNTSLNAPVVGMAATPSGKGYWLVAGDGGVFTFGGAPFFGSIPGQNISLNAPVVGMAATPWGKGYWLVAGDGGVFTFGDARYFGSIPGTNTSLNAPVVGMAATPSGKGYWLVAGDGGVFTFGDAPFFGSIPGRNISLNAPVVGMAATPSGKGYWLVAADGGVFTFGDAPFPVPGSIPGTNISLNKPVVGMAAQPASPDQIIYAGIKGPSLLMITGPFLQLMSLNFTYTPKPTGTLAKECKAANADCKLAVEILTKALHQSIPLRYGADGLFHGSLLFDLTTAKSIEYQYVGDGPSTPQPPRFLSTSDLASGVANVFD